MATAVRTITKKATAKIKAPAKKKAAPKKAAPRKWSKKVTETSDALTLEDKVFTLDDPKKIAASLKRSAEKSKRRKTTAFQSAMSMINFYENRGGKNITAAHKKILDAAKDELRKLYGKEEK